MLIQQNWTLTYYTFLKNTIINQETHNQMEHKFPQESYIQKRYIVRVWILQILKSEDTMFQHYLLLWTMVRSFVKYHMRRISTTLVAKRHQSLLCPWTLQKAPNNITIQPLINMIIYEWVKTLIYEWESNLAKLNYTKVYK